MPTDSIDLTLALQLLQSGPTGILLVNGRGRIRWVNDILLSWLGVAGEDLIGKDSHTLSHPELQQIFQCVARLHLQPRHAPERWLSCHQITLDGRPNHSLAAHYFLDDTPQEHLSHQLREQSLNDALTGLPNRRALMLSLEPQVSRCRRYQSLLSVVLMGVDSDGSRDNNPQRLAVSRLLKDQLRWADLIGCGEEGEFIMILPETGEEDALKLVRKLSAQVAQLPNADGTPISASFGVTAWRKNDDANALLRRANLALAETRGAS
jgi:diguanylate cyclase (GGDEF)-like protein